MQLLSLYQGGHNEDISNTCMTCFREKANQIFGGGGENSAFRNCRITSVRNHQFMLDDGRAMGLQGMINDLVQKSDYPVGDKLTDEINHLEEKIKSNRQGISSAENFPDVAQNFGGYPKKRMKQHNSSSWNYRKLEAQENHLCG
jgi:methylmalonyl-CoA mutase